MFFGPFHSIMLKSELETINKQKLTLFFKIYYAIILWHTKLVKTMF
jgi:hypothetical protein